jgi:hypothetical protein
MHPTFSLGVKHLGPHLANTVEQQHVMDDTQSWTITDVKHDSH